jgi:hypothetical protein
MHEIATSHYKKKNKDQERDRESERGRERVAYLANRIEFGWILLFWWLLTACNIIKFDALSLELRDIEKEANTGKR